MYIGFWVLGFRVEGLGYRVYIGFGVLRFRVSGLSGHVSRCGRHM